MPLGGTETKNVYLIIVELGPQESPTELNDSKQSREVELGSHSCGELDNPLLQLVFNSCFSFGHRLCDFASSAQLLKQLAKRHCHTDLRRH